MNLLKEIFDWVGNLPAWQQDAARRLYENPGGLTDKDYQELCRLALKENGLAPEEVLEPVPMDPARLQQNASSNTLILKSLGNLRHVNKIDPSQTISFSPTGLTVIFGNNGSGKSGYARVFKKACFCRDAGEDVLPDVEIEKERNLVAEATFEVEHDGVSKRIEWRNGCACPELAYISVFDSKSARIVLDSGQEPHYIPYGLDILSALGSVVLPRVKQDIEEKWKALDLSEDVFGALRGDTEVGKLFANLSNASLDVLRRLGTWTHQDLERGQYLTKFLADNNFPARIEEKTFAIRRFSSFITGMEDAVIALNDEHVAGWQQVFEQWRTAKNAETLAAQNLRSGEDLLLGTGGEAWKLMFLKAQEYIASAYQPGSIIADFAKCPLCQQEMDSTARARMKRFAHYVADRVSVELQMCERARKTAEEKINAISEDVIKNHANLDEIEHHVTGGEEQYVRFVTTCGQRKEAIRSAMAGDRAWDNLPSISTEILTTIQGIKARLETENADLQRAMTACNQEALEKERDELRARYRLSQAMKSVESWFERKSLKNQLYAVSHGITTQPITNKVKELAEAAISEPLRLAVNEEFKILGIEKMRLRPSLVSKGKKGRLFNAFELGVANPPPISRVLSEGEQKAIAIASFMAELRVSGHKQAVVFDDPVTSLDHMRRGKVAFRLAQEALTRQVIVFSHEPVFVTALVNMCSKVGAASSVLSLTWSKSSCGVVMPGMPWERQNFQSRIQDLKKLQKRLYEEITDYPSVQQEEDIRKFYGRLRATTELVAQEECLRGTVRRFEDKINMAKLQEVSPLDANAVKDLYDLFGKCSDVFEGHDHASEANEPVPLPDEMKGDIDLLESIIKRIKDARKK